MDALIAFTAQYPTSERLVDAIFWVGQVEDLLAKDGQAIQTFGHIAKTFPDYGRMPHVQLKLGKLLLRNGRLNEGLSVLRKLVASAPSGTSEDVLRKARKEIENIGDRGTQPLDPSSYEITVAQIPAPGWLLPPTTKQSSSLASEGVQPFGKKPADNEKVSADMGTLDTNSDLDRLRRKINQDLLYIESRINAGFLNKGAAETQSVLPDLEFLGRDLRMLERALDTSFGQDALRQLSLNKTDKDRYGSFYLLIRQRLIDSTVRLNELGTIRAPSSAGVVPQVAKAESVSATRSSDTSANDSRLCELFLRIPNATKPEQLNYIDKGVIAEIKARKINCDEKNSPFLSSLSDLDLCRRATVFGQWETRFNLLNFVEEAKRRGLNCGVEASQIASESIQSKRYLRVLSPVELCQLSTSSGVREREKDSQDAIQEAKRRGLDCEKYIELNIRVLADRDVCNRATSDGKWEVRPQFGLMVAEAKRRELDCGVSTSPQVANNPSSATPPNRTGEENRILRERIVKLEAEKNIKEQSILQDTQSPSIRITSTNADGARGTISGIAQDNTGIAELLIDGQPVAVDLSGRFTGSTYIPPGGVEVTIIAYDLKGLSTTQTILIKRDVSTQVSKVSFDSLNPITRQVKSNTNAIALIIGVAEYEKTAEAAYADRDAQVFYDYAHLKLGIPKNRIQTLVNDKADIVGLLSGINTWLKRSVRQGESDVYIFFAGHGLASDNGDTAYLIPYDGAPDFLERTAISRDEVFREVSSVNPRSVTVFLDTCYSGDTRGESRLIAGRPLGIKLQEQSLPAGFTVLTAAGGDQIAKPLEEAKHGMFSYFLMKGMEGRADSNRDNQITARELHTYVRENVVQHSGGSQVPELQGDGEKVLVRFQ